MELSQGLSIGIGTVVTVPIQQANDLSCKIVKINIVPHHDRLTKGAADRRIVIFIVFSPGMKEAGLIESGARCRGHGMIPGVCDAEDL